MENSTYRNQRIALAKFPKGSVARHKRTRKLWRVMGLVPKSDCLRVRSLDGGEEYRFWWKYLEVVHPLLQLAACAEVEAA